MPICNCTTRTTLPTITLSNCPLEIGQIQRILFMRTSGAAMTQTATLAAWQALKALTTNDKLVPAPTVYNPVVAPGDEVIIGENSNETPNGDGVKIGQYGDSITGNFTCITDAEYAALKEFECEKSLGAFFVNQDGQILGVGSGSTIKPFPIGRFSLKSRDAQGFGSQTKNEFTIKLKPDAWNGMVAVYPMVADNVQGSGLDI